MSDAIPSLTEALTLFVTSKKESKKEADNHQELGRFVAWCGRTRTVLEVSPDEVAQYAHQIGKGGAESAQRLSPVKSFLAFWKQEGWIEASLAAHLRIPRARRGSTGAARLAVRVWGGGGVSATLFSALTGALGAGALRRVASAGALISAFAVSTPDAGGAGVTGAGPAQAAMVKAKATVPRQNTCFRPISKPPRPWRRLFGYDRCRPSSPRSGVGRAPRARALSRFPLYRRHRLHRQRLLRLACGR